MKRISMLVVMMSVLAVGNVYAHCEIPCGIYGDTARVKMIAEHAQTIRKSMRMIKELSEEGEKNYNQLIRWVNNKEEHAKEIQDIVYQYFMTQRIKPAADTDDDDDDEYEKYVKEVTLLHKMLRAAMKTKQSVNENEVYELEKLLEEFEESYFGEQVPHTH